MRPEKVFEAIYDLMRVTGNITDTNEVGTVTTITTDSKEHLANGMLVEIGTRVYAISNLTILAYQSYTFDITGTNITALTWTLALYYDYGRALEIGATLKDKKDDPTNKNKRFPLMWLLTDIDQDYNYEENENYQASVTIAFIYLSEQNLKAKKRIENKLEPILDPLVELFKETISTSPGSRYFVRAYGTNLKISQTDKFKYGSIGGNKHVFDDITDAIELNMTLQFFNAGSNCNI